MRMYQYNIHYSESINILTQMENLDAAGWEIISVFGEPDGTTAIVVRKRMPAPWDRYPMPQNAHIDPATHKNQYGIPTSPYFTDSPIFKQDSLEQQVSLLEERVSRLERQRITDKMYRAARTEPVPNKSGRPHMASELEPGWDVMSIDPKSPEVFKKWRKLEGVVAVNDPEGSLCLTFEGGFRYYFSLGDSESNAMIWKVRPVLFRASELEIGMEVREYRSTQYPTWCKITFARELEKGYLLRFDHRPDYIWEVGERSNDEIWEVKNAEGK